jgi:hypothetical protein
LSGGRAKVMRATRSVTLNSISLYCAIKTGVRNRRSGIRACQLRVYLKSDMENSSYETPRPLAPDH